MPDAAGELITAHLRHGQVSDDQIKTFGGEQLQCLGAVSRLGHLMLIEAEQQGDGFSDPGSSSTSRMRFCLKGMVFKLLLFQ
jgi:hypothetical protein